MLCYILCNSKVNKATEVEIFKMHLLYLKLKS